MRAQWNMKCPSFKLSYNFLSLFLAVRGGGGREELETVVFFLFVFK